MSKDIIFPDGIHDKNISYVNQYSVHQFFDNPENTKLFFIFLAQKLLNSSKTSDDNKKYIFNPVAVIENNKAATIDVEYNFLIEALAEWISHYSANETVIHEYRRYYTFDAKQKDKDGNDIFIRKFKDIKIEFSVAEKVMFDYSFDGWLKGDKFHKKCRYDFFQKFLNEILFLKLVWVNVKVSPKFRVIHHHYLLCDNAQNETYVEFNSIKLLSSTMEELLGKTKFKNLKKMGTNYEKITSQKKHVENKIEMLNMVGKKVEKCQPFDINLIEKTRNIYEDEWQIVKEENHKK